MGQVFTTADFGDTRLSRPRDINCLRSRRRVKIAITARQSAKSG
jgi:hypothetical protein